MHIIVIAQKNKDLQDSFAGNIFYALKKSAARHSFQIMETDDASFSKKNSLPENFLLFFFIENKNAISLKWFYDVQLLSIAKKLKTDLLIDLTGCCSKTLKLPQMLIVQDIFHFQNAETKMNAIEKFSTKNAAVFFNKASCIITYSAFAKKLIEEKYHIDDEEIKIIFPSANDFYKPIEWKIRETVKEKYAEGKEFFVAKIKDDENEFVNILKAFSVFKKWQQSNMKLLLIDFDEDDKISFKEKISTYKYRNDVRLIKSADENKLAQLLAASYALLHFSTKDGELGMSANAMQCCVPVISSQRKSVCEICAEAALYAENETPQSLGKQMVVLYKDEKLRNEMIKVAAKNAAKFDAEKNAAELWKFISVHN